MLPLENIKVLDFSQNVAGPYAGMILGELGADVIKIEPNEGDPTRNWGPPFWNGNSTSYMALNRNKTRVTIDLKTPQGFSEVMAMLDDTDVMITSSRMGVMKRLALDYDTLHKKFPKLVYGEITAFGINGPRSQEPGYDPLMQALTGIMSVTGGPGQEPTRVGVSLVDMSTGMWTAIGIISALKMRDKTGEGYRVNSSLFETAISWMALPFTSFWASGKVPRGWGSGTSMISPYEAFKTLDGWIMIAAGNDKLFQKLSEALGKPEWAKDPKFIKNSDRVTNRDELKRLIEEITVSMTSLELEELVRKYGIPVAPVQNVAKISEDPQLQACGIIQSIEHPNIPDFRSLGIPLLINEERPPLRIPPPT